MRQLGIHPKIISDVDQILAHYEHAATLKIADDFFEELKTLFCGGLPQTPFLSHPIPRTAAR